ncbi:Type II/IV secretion system protein [Bacillus thuringiensis IBL 200]|nr:Type II/IV secretion system protein [Bacillus thuringiensis IBL 200]
MSLMNSHEEKQQKVERILEGSFLRPYMKDKDVTDIKWNGTFLRIENRATGRYIPKSQPTTEEVNNLMRQIAAIQGEELTESEPILDTAFGDLRVNTIHPVCAYGGTFALRVSKPHLAITKLTDLVSEDISVLLELLIKARGNFTISGGTGTGKTELQKLFVGFMDDYDSIFLIEDTPDSHIKELYPNKDISSLRTLANNDREKKVDIWDLIKAGLRNNPDWIMISETRGKEAAGVLDSAKTDHSIITTVHAKSGRAIPGRYVPMMKQAPAYANTDDITILRDIIELLPYGIQMRKEHDGGEVIRDIKEVVEFIDYSSEKGLIYRTIYQKENEWYPELGEYKTIEKIQPVSERTIKLLKDAKLYHLLPDVFKEKVAK